MNKIKLKINILKKEYLSFLPRFSILAVITYILDIIIFSLFRAKIGSNGSAILSFVISQIFLFTVLNLSFNIRVKSLKKGLFIQFLIGIGSLIIHISIINLIDFIIFNLNKVFYYQNYIKSFYYGVFIKLICGAFGYIWSSIMTNIYLFKK
tara:strand:- start:66 stop:518 length:453 start_codon:yes stop_codon:yes gene_type:complete